ncbi:MAG TPA: HAMP domain-containing sensor histidine kinase [Ilumatobacteraceae bacterium]|nr:HAMP domain-containing sensor histidine kinase [Ilumatobacteraceae bacterium]
MDGTGDCFGAATNEHAERDHEMRAALFGIQAVARALHEHRDRLPSADIDQLALTIESEARRLQLMLAPPGKRQTTFDLGEAILPAIVMISALGVVVRNAVPIGTWVKGRREDTAQVVLALLNNARIHAGTDVDVRVESQAGLTTLYIEDRGPGIRRPAGRDKFKRGRPGAGSPGSGLGLFIAQRLMVEQGGSLTVGSRVGGGASCTLHLPTSTSGLLAEQPQVAARPAGVR